jgi:hypothetical protein
LKGQNTVTRLKSKADDKLNLLVAYPYMTEKVMAMLKRERARIRFVLDSGAFTAWKAGKPIALDDYCRFLETLPLKPWRYFALDVVGDPAATQKNYETMLTRGFCPIPVFTRGEQINKLNMYYNTSEVVGIGGLVKTEGNCAFVRGIMKHVGDRRVHWLGFTRMELLRRYRPYMCDSSTYNVGVKFGSLPLYFSNGHLVQIRRERFQVGSSIPPAAALAIQKLGFDPKRLVDRKEWDGRGLAYQIGIAGWVKLMVDVKRELGTHLFLAGGNIADTQLMLENLERFKGVKAA